GFSADNGLVTRGLTFSPIKGPEGNIEYLLWLQKTAGDEKRESLGRELIDNVVNEAYKALNDR
ncbi:MAG: TlyA family RNA methyltransferase, partial [Lachnospiraceae bacterium]|nr:TlyA family RNA methyltransferase [Lachnospiraceae bacterium]